MQELLGNTPGIFLLLTFLVFGPLAFATGQGVASRWEPWPMVAVYCIMLAAVERFTDYALADGELLSAGGFALSALMLCGVGLVAWRATSAAMMVRQYPWMYERDGLLGWRPRTGG